YHRATAAGAGDRMVRGSVIELEPSRMQRLLRIYLVGCMAIAFAYLALHVREPLRLNVGDPWSDAEVVSSVASIKQHGFTTDAIDVDLLIADEYRPTHPAPLPETVYGAIGKLGIGDIG